MNYKYVPSGKFDAPWSFNDSQEGSSASDEGSARSAEVDGETGNYYYGESSRSGFEHKPKRRSAMLARPSPASMQGYYNPTWSVWLSVDRMAAKYPNSSPYVFSGNNPILYLDPNGDSLKATAGAWIAILEGFRGVFRTSEENSPFSRTANDKVTINENFDPSSLKSPEQEELYDHYYAIVTDAEFHVEADAIGNDVEFLGPEGQMTSLLKERAQGITVYNLDGKYARVYLSNSPMYWKNGKWRKQPQQEDEMGITSIHEIAGHSYYALKNAPLEINNSSTTDFDNPMRRVYRGKYSKNYFKRRPSIPHN